MTSKGIFLVEDDEIYARFIQKSLQKEGYYPIDIFESAEQCLKEIDRDHIAPVVLIDYFLPGMNGLELYSIIKNRYKEVQAIMVSSNSDANLVLDLIKKGIRKYVIKDENVIGSLVALIEENDDLFIDLNYA
jgi:DNA-binding NtrC family response regulator